MDPRTEQMLAERAQRAAASPGSPGGPSASGPGARGWAKPHGFTLKLLVGAVIVVFFAGYSLLVILPAKRADRLAAEAQAAEQMRTHLASKQVAKSDCLAKADADAAAQWAAACKARREGVNCALPQNQIDTLGKAETAARNACLLVK